MIPTPEDQGADCPQPIDAAVLADYWCAALPDAEEAIVEEHLMGCDRCGARLREVVALADGVRRLVRDGSLRMVVTDSFPLRAASGGLRVREYAVPSGGSVQCTITEDDDLLIARVAADMRGATRVDLAFCDAQGVEQFRMHDIPVRPDVRDVVWQFPTTVAKALPTSTMMARLVGFDEGGRERLIGEYTFHHTRSLPGPGAW